MESRLDGRGRLGGRSNGSGGVVRQVSGADAGASDPSVASSRRRQCSRASSFLRRRSGGGGNKLKGAGTDTVARVQHCRIYPSWSGDEMLT